MTDLISREAALAAIDTHPAPKSVRDEFARVIRALPATQVSGERVHHVKRGSTYRVIGRGAIQTDTPLTDYAEVVVYQCEADGKLWVRPISEFEDGRFAEMPVDASQTPDPDTNDHQYSPSMNPNDAGDCRLCGASMSAHFVTSGAERRWIEDTEAGLYDDPVLSDPRVKALVDALELQNIWVKAALECEAWSWDAQQHDAASESLDLAAAALRAIGGEA